MGSLFFVLVLLAGLVLLVGGVAFSLQRIGSSGRALNHRCVVELGELKSLLAHRHVILSHLMDAVPEMLDHPVHQQSCRQIHRRATDALNQIAPEAPDASCIRTCSDRENELMEFVDDLMHQINADPSLRQAATIASCIEGLEQATRKIRDAEASYNASAINFSNYIDALPLSIVRRRFPTEGYRLFDLSRHSSGDSGIRVKL